MHLKFICECAECQHQCCQMAHGNCLKASLLILEFHLYFMELSQQRKRSLGKNKIARMSHPQRMLCCFCPSIYIEQRCLFLPWSGGYIIYLLFFSTRSSTKIEILSPLKSICQHNLQAQNRFLTNCCQNNLCQQS